MRFNKTLILGFLTTVVFQNLEAQELPSVIPPSPQIQNFMKFGDYPVGHNTGIPDISIPLYTIKSGDIEIPITLKYHSDGIKPKQPDVSNIGAGWSLDVGGIISRKIKGKADELYQKPNPFPIAANLMQYNYSNSAFMSEVLTGKTVDVENDIFSYSFLGRSGNFVIEDNRNGTFSAYSYPFVPYNINVQTATPAAPKYYRSISGIDITDDNGYTFKFGHSNIEVANDSFEPVASGWFLEEIASPTTTNKVQMLYETIPQFSFQTASYSIGVTDNPQRASGGRDCPPNTFPAAYGKCTPNGSQIVYDTKNLSRINFKNGYVKFNLSTDKRLVESILIYNNSNQILESFVFNRDKFPNSTLNRLNSIEIRDSNGSKDQAYNFTYDVTNPISDNQCGTDRWGYCNGLSTGVPCPALIVPVIDAGPYFHDIAIGSAAIDPNETYAQRFILQSIKYPTGGTTEFSYELNRYKDFYDSNPSSPGEPGGGLRIKKIISKSNVQEPIIKSFEYEPGFIEFPLTIASGNTAMETASVYEQCYEYDNILIYYAYRDRSFTANIPAYLGENRVYYRKITEYIGDKDTNSGKSIFTYSYQNPNGIARDIVPYIANYRNWGNGLLKSTDIYKKISANNFVKTKSINNEYEFITKKELNNLFAFMYCYYWGANDPIAGYYNRKDLLSNAYPEYLPPVYLAYDYKITTGAYYLKSIEEKEYFNGDSLTVFKENKHENPNNFYLTEEKTTGSDGTISIAKFKYPQDFSASLPYSDMVNSKHIWSPIVETDYYKNSISQANLLQITKTNYKNWGNSVFKPETIEKQVGNNPSKTFLRYLNYDSEGNTSSVSREGGSKISYIWSYNKQYPIAEIKNVDYSMVVSALGGEAAITAFSIKPSPTSVELNNFLASLRTSFPNAQISTFVYDPLVGLLSQTDAKGQTTSYEYDNFQRLKNVRDQNGNIIKNNTYHYKP